MLKGSSTKRESLKHQHQSHSHLKGSLCSVLIPCFPEQGGRPLILILATPLLQIEHVEKSLLDQRLQEIHLLLAAGGDQALAIL